MAPISLDLSEGDGGHVGVGEEEDIRVFLNTLVELVLQLLLVVCRVLLRLRQRDNFTSLRASHLCLGDGCLLFSTSVLVFAKGLIRIDSLPLSYITRKHFYRSKQSKFSRNSRTVEAAKEQSAVQAIQIKREAGIWGKGRGEGILKSI